MGKKLTKEEYERLKPYEKELRSAVKNSFLHMSGSDFMKVAEIYKDVIGKELTKSQKGCNTCRLNALKLLGGLYLAYTSELKEEEKKEKKPRQKKLENITE